MLFAFLLVALLLEAKPLWAGEPGWQKEWNQSLAAAKREGKVVLSGWPDVSLRRELPRAFSEKFGIPLEYVPGRGEVVQRLRAERRAGLYTTDVMLNGTSTMIEFYMEKFLDPLKPALILPDVLDQSKWKAGKLWFIDPEEKYILRLFNSVSRLMYVNTQYVKLQEFTLSKELLNPKWKGKISVFDPTVSGPGAGTAVSLYLQFGEDFVKRLYIDQQPIFSRDNRQLTDWLLRGTHPISFDADSAEVKRLRLEGFPLAVVYKLPDGRGEVSARAGLVGLVGRAPHPHAARLFVNWIASKEGLEIVGRAQLAATTRNDVDESYMQAEEIPHPGINYLDSSSFEQDAKAQHVRNRIKELLREKK